MKDLKEVEEYIEELEKELHDENNIITPGFLSQCQAKIEALKWVIERG